MLVVVDVRIRAVVAVVVDGVIGVGVVGVNLVVVGLGFGEGASVVVTEMLAGRGVDAGDGAFVDAGDGAGVGTGVGADVDAGDGRGVGAGVGFGVVVVVRVDVVLGYMSKHRPPVIGRTKSSWSAAAVGELRNAPTIDVADTSLN